MDTIEYRGSLSSPNMGMFYVSTNIQKFEPGVFAHCGPDQIMEKLGGSL